MSEPLLEARGLCKSYVGGPRRVDVLEQLDFVLGAGETVAVVGESGVGKSTLLHLLGGLDRPDAGTLCFAGEDPYAGGPGRLAAYRNRSVGFVFQFHYLLPEFTARENVELPLRIRRAPGDLAPAAQAILERLGLGARADHRPAQLSGGEQQRVALARALVGEPALLLADEPTGNLDPRTGAQVLEALTALQRERGFAWVLVTHNERLARGSARVLRLAGGRLEPLGDADAPAYFQGR